MAGMNEQSKVASHLAQNIGKLRLKKNMSQQQLAKLALIPRSTLTNIESGAGNPSLTNLVKISNALGVSIEELLSRPRSECVLIAADKVPAQERAQGQVKIFKLLPDKIKGLEIDRIEIAGGAVMGGQPHLAGTKEYLSVLQGELNVHIAGELYIVKKGDVLAFPGNQPHSYRNPGRSGVVAVSLVIPIPLSL